MKAKSYTDGELIKRVWDVENIRALMGRRAYYAADEERRRELDELWVREKQNIDTASLGSNWGYYVGIENISAWYVAQHDADMRRNLKSLPYAEHTDENLGFGCMSIRPMSTPLVVLAGDGKTARGLWYTFGQRTIARPDGTAEALWIYEKTAVDFIREADGFRIWHLVTTTDLCGEAGIDAGDLPVDIEPGTDPLENEFGRPDVAFVTHNPRYNWADGYPPEPMPYYTFDIHDSYAPEGHPSFAGRSNNK